MSEALPSRNNPGKMENNSISLDDVAKLVIASHDPLGILVYGSCGRDHWHNTSDFDLLCVSRHEQNRHLMMNCGEVAVDIFASTFSLLEQTIRSDIRTNNNFVLDAFVHGLPLDVGDGSAQVLSRLAKEVWEAGPLQPSLAEQQSIAGAVQKGLVAAKRFVIKSEWSPEWLEIAHIKCGYLFLEIVHAYCRVNRLWASAIWEMLMWNSPQYQDLNAMCRRYLRATSFADQLSALEDLGAVTLSRITLSRQR
jgi:Nucleotidyltransferase domain